MTSRARTARAAAGAAAMLLVAASCGGDGGEPTSAARRTPTTDGATTSSSDPSTSSSTVDTTSSTAAPTTAGTAGPAGSTTTGGTAAPASATTTSAGRPATTQRPATVPALGLKLTQIARLDQPLDLVAKPGSGRLYVAEQKGRVKVLREGRAEVVLDISREVSTGNEQGLLGIAFSPDGRYLYFDFTDTRGDTRLEEVATAGDGLDLDSRRLVLAVDQPAANHNGGHLAFGPDGRLWFGLGDGGGSNDQFGNAQNLGSILGDIIRIDPRPGNAGAYGIPADNPFVGRPGARGEIAVLGLRNPWRFSFDRGTGDLWIGDVGQNTWEEVDHLPAGRILGANLGWPYFEGSHAHRGTPPAGTQLVGPVHDYGRGDGQSVAGGVVYRGAAIPELHGVYLFADTYEATLWGWAPGGRRSFLDVPGGLVAGFGEDAAGEVHVLSLAGGVYRIDRA